MVSRKPMLTDLKTNGKNKRGLPRFLWLSSLISVLFVYLYFCPGLNESFVSRLLFHPVKLSGRLNEAQIISGVSGEEVFFSNPKDTSSPQLSGWLYRQPDSKLIVLFNNGNTGNVSTRRWKQERLLTSGVSLFAFDYRGFGRSDGSPTVVGVEEDACTAFDYLVNERDISPSNIVLYGESLGSCMAIATASRRKCGGLIIQSGCVSAERLCKEQVPILNLYPSFLFFRPPLDNRNYLMASHPPLLIVVGQQDEIVPVAHSQALFDLATTPKQLVELPNSKHNDFSLDAAQLQASLDRFFSEVEKNNENTKPQ